ncbi:hypothetical protein P3T76_007530 [Phytophthora citrophthora]|uniref:Uncharacterized protein n=1 Tax=Phytophthora citrophthora TaxID=4793 RepID=A0AAD9LN49_9STRA|nr:hypothetical protein P3T76_007530 [Phytophthora citrophthora]
MSSTSVGCGTKLSRAVMASFGSIEVVEFLPSIVQVSGSTMEWLEIGASSVWYVLEEQRNCCGELYVATVLFYSKGLPFDCVWASIRALGCSHDASNKAFPQIVLLARLVAFTACPMRGFVLANTLNA